MTPDELIEVVGRAYGEPTDDVFEALCNVVHETYDVTATEFEQAEVLLSAFGRIQMRLHKVQSAVGLLRAPLQEPLN